MTTESAILFETLFRETQNTILQYRTGQMAVIAVPGSGKTFTLAHLAANLISRSSSKDIEKGREILLVTFSNSAVKTLQNRIEGILQQQSKYPEKVGYRIRTLHGLARDIIAERPALAGLTDDFRIIDEQYTHQLIHEAVFRDLKSNQSAFEDFIAPSLRADEKRLENIQSRSLPELAVQVCRRFIRYCKDHSMTPQNFYTKELHQPIIQFALRVYEDYQRRLAYQSAVDFDDLVMLALNLLNESEALKSRLQKRWTHILEDEAQDSSFLQEKLLHVLSTEKNWVRVGDPNQAINSTFTTANPKFLRAFAQKAGVTVVHLNQSGRSGRPIMDFANALVKWSTRFYPVHDLREALDSRLIESVSIGDLNANPSTNESNIHIFYEPGKDITPEQELQVVMHSLTRWLPNNSEKTVAVLVPENRHGYQLAEMLRQADLPHDELLRTTSDLRQIVKALLAVLSYLADPLSSSLMSALYRDVWWAYELGQTGEIKAGQEPHALRTLLNEVTKTLSQFKNLEDFFYPTSGKEEAWYTHFSKFPETILSDIDLFRKQTVQWLNAFYLPFDQLIITLGRAIFHKPDDLAVMYKLTSFARSLQELENGSHLRDLVNELRAISENQRRYFDFEEAAAGYHPTPGVVTVSTIHASKGLEWDRVYVLGVNNRAFPEGRENENPANERWFIRDQLNLEAEIISMAESIVNQSPYLEGNASHESHLAYAGERLRLLYVAITRAKKEVILLWNMGYQWKNTPNIAQPALALKTLKEYLDGSLSL